MTHTGFCKYQNFVSLHIYFSCWTTVLLLLFTTNGRNLLPYLCYPYTKKLLLQPLNNENTKFVDLLALYDNTNSQS